MYTTATDNAPITAASLIKGIGINKGSIDSTDSNLANPHADSTRIATENIFLYRSITKALNVSHVALATLLTKFIVFL
jgi:hypothetical protein